MLNETHPVLRNAILGTYTFLNDNLEAIFIATWIISLVTLIIVTLKIRWPNNGDWDSEEVLVYEKMMNREGLKSSTVKEIKELIQQEKKEDKAKVDLQIMETSKKKAKKAKEPKAINLKGDALKLSNQQAKSKYEKKLDKNLCDDPEHACSSKGKFKDTCTQLECCVWAYDAKKESVYKSKFGEDKRDEWGECVEGSADDDGPTMTTPEEQWEYYYYKDKVKTEGKDKGKLIKQNINN